MHIAPFSASSRPGSPRATTSCARRWMACGQALLLAAGVLAAAPHVHAQTTGELTTIRSFNGPTGQAPTEALTLGNDGIFYGVTSTGGLNGQGTVFRVTTDGAITVLHNFDSTTDGLRPRGKLLLASDGNFYGVTQSSGPAGGGTVYRISTGGSFSVVHAFTTSGAQGKTPLAGLIQGADGALYGTTQAGDIEGDGMGDGTLYQLTLTGSFAVLHFFDFETSGVGGYAPNTSLVQGSDGNFYGVTREGGDNGAGTVYRLGADGSFTNLYSFKGTTDGSTPLGPLVEGNNGVFYGLTTEGGGSNRGTFFSITGSGTLTTVRTLITGDPLLTSQTTGLTKSGDGTFYLTAASGTSGTGAILQFTTTGVITTVYPFIAPASNTIVGRLPVAPLTQAQDGSFYGTTSSGGASGYGTVYHLVVYPYPPFFIGQVDLDNGVKYLSFPNGNFFGFYSFLSDPHYIYHDDLGYEYVFDARDGQGGVYLYDFKSSDFFYTSQTFPFPYLYDFNLAAVLYYYPDRSRPGRYSGPTTRYFYNFRTSQIISK